MNKKKYLAVILAVILIMMIVAGIRTFSLQKEITTLEKEIEEAEKSYPDIYNVINSITLSSFEDKVVDQDNFIVYIGRPTCGDCTEFEPKLIEMIKKRNLQNKIVYLNVALLRQDDMGWEAFVEKYNIQYTPTLARFEKGKLIEKVNWTPEEGTDLEKFSSFLDLV